MVSSRPWPFDDDEDRPSGSVRPLSQADLQAILAHLGDDPDQLLAGTGADRPVVALRLRASIGSPGASAHAEYRRRRAVEWAAWTRTLPWRVAVILGMGVGGGVFGSLLATRLGLILSGLATVAAAWALRFRPSPKARAWRRGAIGERRTARLLGPLERHGWAILHDLAIPGSTANIDSPGHRPRRRAGHRLQAVSGAAAARPDGATLARPFPPRPGTAGGVVRGRPGRPGPN
jgi:hypothetical protein